MSLIRIMAIARKETLQIIRDYRSLILAFLLPVILIFLFGYAITLDMREIPTAILDYDNSTASRELIRKFTNSHYFVETKSVNNQKDLEWLIDKGKVKVGLVIPPDFSNQLLKGTATIQTIVDGSDANTSQSTLMYTSMIINDYNLKQLELKFSGMTSGFVIESDLRFWFNPELDSQVFLVPGLISLIMTILGSLLTSLTVAREWERGTMELLISTPIKPVELAIGKLLPYYVIGIIDVLLATYVGVVVFDVPLHGSIISLLLYSSIFLVTILSIGYTISVITKSQQVAYQVSMLTSFLPGFLLSGFLFPISSMPLPVQIVSLLVPGRYFITMLRGIFLKGSGFITLLPQIIALSLFAIIFIIIAANRFEKKVQ